MLLKLLLTIIALLSLSACMSPSQRARMEALEYKVMRIEVDMMAWDDPECPEVNNVELPE